MFSYALKENTTIRWGGGGGGVGGGGHGPCFRVDEITCKINFPVILSNLETLFIFVHIFAIN